MPWANGYSSGLPPGLPSRGMAVAKVAHDLKISIECDLVLKALVEQHTNRIRLACRLAAPHRTNRPPVPR
jgi:hypothetical protein